MAYRGPGGWYHFTPGYTTEEKTLALQNNWILQRNFAQYNPNSTDFIYIRPIYDQQTNSRYMGLSKVHLINCSRYYFYIITLLFTQYYSRYYLKP